MDATNLIERGIELYGDGKLVEALSQFDAAVSVAPSDAYGHYWRAVVLIDHTEEFTDNKDEKSVLKEALISLNDAIKLKKDYEFIYQRSLIHERLEDWDDTIRDASDVLEHMPIEKNTYVQAALLVRARAHREKNEYAAALDDFQAFLKLQEKFGRISAAESLRDDVEELKKKIHSGTD